MNMFLWWSKVLFLSMVFVVEMWMIVRLVETNSADYVFSILGIALGTWTLFTVDGK